MQIEKSKPCIKCEKKKKFRFVIAKTKQNKKCNIIGQLLHVQCQCKKVSVQNVMAIVIYLFCHFPFHIATVTHATHLIHKVCMSTFMMTACLNLKGKKKQIRTMHKEPKEINCWNNEFFCSWIYSPPNKKNRFVAFYDMSACCMSKWISHSSVARPLHAKSF